MRLSISLSESDIAFIDEYARTRQIESRSAVVRTAVQLLRVVELGDDYSAAWAEWAAGADSLDWQRTSVDGLADSTGSEPLRAASAPASLTKRRGRWRKS